MQGLLASSPRRLAGLLQYVLYADTYIQLEVSFFVFIFGGLRVQCNGVVCMLEHHGACGK